LLYAWQLEGREIRSTVKKARSVKHETFRLLPGGVNSTAA